MAGRRYRQLLLFLAVLILPSVMIAIQGFRLSAQERELEKTGREDLQKRRAGEIGQEIVTRLESIKKQEMANVPGTPIRLNSYSDPAVVAVGWMDGDRLVWPWDVQSTTETLPEDPEFVRAMDGGIRAEYTEQRSDRAADLYRQALSTARYDMQRAKARLGLARVQLRAGQRTAAVATYREVLKLASTVIDDHGLSCWSAAAAPLLELGVRQDVLERVSEDLESTTVWPAFQMYRFRAILETLRGSHDQT